MDERLGVGERGKSRRIHKETRVPETYSTNETVPVSSEENQINEGKFET